MDSESSKPTNVGSNDQLGPLPEGYVTALSDYFDAEGMRHSMAYTVDQMRAYAAQERAAERERWEALREWWEALREWTENYRREHEAGTMMSIAESIHGAATLRSVLNRMAELDGPNAGLGLRTWRSEMDERDAKAQGLEVHRRDMAFVRGYVTCTTCGCNYHSAEDRPGHRVPTFCQRYSIPIDPAATDANILRAEACDQWVHEALDRNKIVHPDHAYRYDKWQEK